MTTQTIPIVRARSEARKAAFTSEVGAALLAAVKESPIGGVVVGGRGGKITIRAVYPLGDPAKTNARR